MAVAWAEIAAGLADGLDGSTVEIRGRFRSAERPRKRGSTYARVFAATAAHS